MPTSTRIMTRSRARANPDQYTIIPAPLKIVKVLVEELISAAPGSAHRSVENITAAELEQADDAGSDDSGWEDDEGFLDLGAGVTKESLMAMAADDAPSKVRDDETQGFLLAWFGAKANEEGFGAVFGQLTADEQEKLRSMGG